MRHIARHDGFCYKCGDTFPRTGDYFYRNSSNIDGLQCVCKKCFGNYRKEGKRVITYGNYKVCYKCNESLPRTLDFFYNSPNRKDGLTSICKKCNILVTETRHLLNPDKKREYRRKTLKKLYKNNDEFRIYRDLKARIDKSLKIQGVKKTEKTIVLLGCTASFYKEYIISMLLPGMTWENRSVNTWHIDHIRPIASFNLFDKEEQKMAFNYKNCQPLWASDNHKKSSIFNGIKYYRGMTVKSPNGK